MTKYEYLIKRADDCASKALSTNDVKLKMFYNKASKGYKIKASKLTLEEAGEEIMLIYISGKITGNENYMCDFMNAELKIKKDFPNAEIVNPINTTGCNDWAEYMREDLTLLLRCNTIYMIKGWRRSKGAKLEYKIARALGMNVIFGE